MPSVEESLCRGLFTVPYTVFTRWQASRIAGIQPYSVIVYENIPEYLSLFLIYYIRFLGVCRLYLYYTTPLLQPVKLCIDFFCKTAVIEHFMLTAYPAASVQERVKR